MQERRNAWSRVGRNIAQALFGMSVALASVSTTVAQDTPMGPKWWPSEWGPEDQRGAMNRITPQKILQAVSLIKNWLQVAASIKLAEIEGKGL